MILASSLVVRAVPLLTRELLLELPDALFGGGAGGPLLGDGLVLLGEGGGEGRFGLAALYCIVGC